MNGSTILLVDDDEVLSQVLQRVLTRDGYTVVQAATVAQALERAREQPISVGLIDLRLPDGDGVELARKLEKQIGRFPLILMTASPFRLHDEPELAKGFAQVLTKPLDLDEIRRAITSVINTRSPVRVAASARPHSRPQAPFPLPQQGEKGHPADQRGQQPTASGQRHLLRWAALVCVLFSIPGLIVGLPALGMPGIQHWLESPKERLAVPIPESQARLVSQSNEIELPAAVVQRLGVKTAPVPEVVAPQKLELAGSLSFEPNLLGSVQSRFPGEVITIGETTYKDNYGQTRRRLLDYGDRVTKGQILAVVYCKDLGEKKSELVEVMTQLAVDEKRLADRKEAYRQGAYAEDSLNQIRLDVASGRIKEARIERTLRTWKVPDEEIAAVKEEAHQVSAGKKPRDIKKEMEWAKVEVRAPFDSTIVEKNLHLGKMVDPTFDLYKVADLRKLGVVVHAYEEDLRTLQELPRGYPWQIRAGADLNNRLLQNDGLQKIGLIVDPSQHTDPVMGRVDNSAGDLRAGQFVTATVNLRPPENVVSVPSSALVEDGDESIVFVQPDPKKLRYLLRRVSVERRLDQMVYVRKKLTKQQAEKGLQVIEPKEIIVTEGALELQAALEDLKAKAKAKK